MAGVSVRVAGAAVVVLSTGIARTRTGTALLASAKNRISVVAIQTLLAVPPTREISAADAGSVPGVTVLGVAITLAGLAVGEAPLSRKALVALPPSHTAVALTLARYGVAEPGDGALRVTVALAASIRAKPIGPRSALVTALANHVGLTHTLPSDFVAHCTERALQITQTGQSSVVDDGGDTTQQLDAHLCQDRHGGHLEGLQAPVGLHFFSVVCGYGVVAMETGQFIDFGQKDQRINEDEGSWLSIGGLQTLEADADFILVVIFKAKGL